METSPKTKFFNAQDADPKWFVINVEGMTLGRAASQVAHILRGKHKPSFTPNSDQGDFVIVLNSEKIKVQGKRGELKEYFHNTMYPGGGRFQSYKEMMHKNPEWVFENAVKGMLPHNRLGRKLGRKLKVYRGTEHPHAAQQPVEFKLVY